MDPTQMAQGAPQASPQGMPQQAPQGQAPMQATPGQIQSADPQKITQALQAAIQQAVDSQGYVDLNKLILLWPQIVKQFGLNIPFQTVMQMLSQNPEILDKIITEMGLAGIIKDGKRISAQQLMGMGTGASPMMAGGS